MNKKQITILFLFVFLFFSACTNNSSQNTTISTQSNLELTSNVDYSTIPNSFEHNREVAQDSGGGELTLQKYRSIYYSIPSPFWDVVDENSRNDIYGEYWEEPYSEINIMRMKIFVEEYNVPREKFDAANAEWARIVKENLYGTPVINPLDYANQEFDEVYNADIIYTFDDEIINEYYLSHNYPYCYESEYESAVQNGLYVTQTVEIIDISNFKEELAFFNQLKEEKTLLKSETTVENETENADVTEITETPEETTVTPSETQADITA